MKLLITGSTGFLGSRALLALREKQEVSVIPSALLRGELTAQRYMQLAAAIAEQAPDVILHTAAIANMADAERNPDESWQANVALPLALARISAKLGSKLIFCSSDQVYNGCVGKGPFAENELLLPMNVYGRHKLEAEERVMDRLPSAVSLRLTWMYDLPAYGLPMHQNLLTNLLSAALRQEPLRVSATDYRGVTYVRQVVDNLPAAFMLDGGAYNFGSESELSVWEIAKAWHIALGLGIAQPEPLQGAPRSLCMDCAAIKDRGINFDGSAEGIQRLIQEYGLSQL